MNNDIWPVSSEEYRKVFFKIANSRKKEKKRQIMNCTHINTTIKSGGYIVASVKKSNNEFSASNHPAFHFARNLAVAEAERLAANDSSKKFIVLYVEGIAAIPAQSAVSWE